LVFLQQKRHSRGLFPVTKRRIHYLNFSFFHFKCDAKTILFLMWAVIVHLYFYIIVEQFMNKSRTNCFFVIFYKVECRQIRLLLFLCFVGSQYHQMIIFAPEISKDSFSPVTLSVIVWSGRLT
jgi:hypothetical protein